MEVNKFEKHIKDQANKTGDNVDTEALWNSVSNKLNERKKRPFLYWIWGAMIIGAIGSIYQIDHATLFTKEELATDSDMVTQPKKKNIEQSPVNTALIDKSDIGLDQSRQSIQERKPDISINAQDRTHTNQIEYVAKESGKSNLQNFGYSSNSQPTLGSSVYQKNASSTSIQKEQKAIHEMKMESEKRVSLNNQNIIDEKDFLNKHFSKDQYPDPQESPSIISQDGRAYHSENSVINRNEYLILPRIPSLHQTLKLNNDSRPMPQLLLNRRSLSKWSLGVESGIGASMVKHKLISSDAINNAYMVRSKSMRPLMSFDLSARVGYNISPKIKLCSGISYGQLIHESTKSLTATERVLIDNVLIEQIIGPEGTEEVYGEGYVTKETVSIRNRISRYHTLSIPIFIELSAADNSFSPLVGIGIDYSFMLKRAGYIHLDSSDEYSSKEDLQNVLAGSLGFSANAYLGGRLALSDFNSVTARFLYRKEFFSHFNNSLGFTEKYSTLQLRIGVESKF